MRSHLYLIKFEEHAVLKMYIDVNKRNIILLATADLNMNKFKAFKLYSTKKNNIVKFVCKRAMCSKYKKKVSRTYLHLGE